MSVWRWNKRRRLVTLLMLQVEQNHIPIWTNIFWSCRQGLKLKDGDEQRRPVTLYNAASLPPAGANTLDACTMVQGGCISFVFVFWYLMIKYFLIFHFVFQYFGRMHFGADGGNNSCVFWLFMYFWVWGIYYLLIFHCVFKHFVHLDISTEQSSAD